MSFKKTKTKMSSIELYYYPYKSTEFSIPLEHITHIEKNKFGNWSVQGKSPVYDKEEKICGWVKFDIPNCVFDKDCNLIALITREGN